MLHPRLEFFARCLKLTPNRTVFLEGGLGSQMMGFMLYLIRKEHDPATKCDVTYFLRSDRGGGGAPICGNGSSVATESI